MLHDLQAGDRVEGAALAGQLLHPSHAVGDGELLGVGVAAGGLDVLRRRVDAGYGGAQPGEGLADQAAAAADVEDGQAGEWLGSAGRSVEVLQQ